MKKEKILNSVKKVTAGLIAVTMLFAGVLAYSQEAEAAVPTETTVSSVHSDTGITSKNIWNIYLELDEALEGASEEWTKLQGLKCSVNGGESQALTCQIGGAANKLCLTPSAEILSPDVPVGTILTIQAGSATSSQGSKGVKFVNPVVLARIANNDNYKDWILLKTPPTETKVSKVGVAQLTSKNVWNIYLHLENSLEGYAEYTEFAGLTCSVDDGTSQSLSLIVDDKANQVVLTPSSTVLPSDVPEGTKLTIHAGQAVAKNGTCGIKFTESVTLQRNANPTEDCWDFLGMGPIDTDEVCYEERTDIADFWSKESKKAPLKEGFVFGGWFKESAADVPEAEQEGRDYYEPFTEAELEAELPQKAFAKFVPAKVLSVKAQNEDSLTAETKNNISREKPTYVRVMSSLDSKNYQKVGFDIWLANRLELKTETDGPLETSKIYTGIMVGETTKYAADVFDSESKYLSVWQLGNINVPSNVEKIIYVRPYWITTDGTKVEGLAKYVHMEDEYMNYVSVPINILDKGLAAQIAAGRVDIAYTSAEAGKEVALTYIDVEAGRLVPEMETLKVENENVIKIIGNAKTVDEYHTGETLYANVRFQRPETNDANVNFSTSMLDFCDWNKTPVMIDKTWDVTYVVNK